MHLSRREAHQDALRSECGAHYEVKRFRDLGSTGARCAEGKDVSRDHHGIDHIFTHAQK